MITEPRRAEIKRTVDNAVAKWKTENRYDKVIIKTILEYHLARIARNRADEKLAGSAPRDDNQCYNVLLDVAFPKYSDHEEQQHHKTCVSAAIVTLDDQIEAEAEIRRKAGDAALIAQKQADDARQQRAVDEKAAVQIVKGYLESAIKTYVNTYDLWDSASMGRGNEEGMHHHYNTRSAPTESSYATEHERTAQILRAEFKRISDYATCDRADAILADGRTLTIPNPFKADAAAWIATRKTTGRGDDFISMIEFEQEQARTRNRQPGGGDGCGIC